MRTRDLTLVALFAALTAVAAQIAFTLPFLSRVPFTLQVFAVLVAGATLGARRGFLSQVVYLLLGVAGAPVFAQFHGGAAVLASPTAGYLWAFPPAALVAGWGAERRSASGGLRPVPLSVGLLGGVTLIYALGAIGLVVSGAVPSLSLAVQVGVIPFIPFDLLKAVLAAVVASRVRGIIPHPLGMTRQS